MTYPEIRDFIDQHIKNNSPFDFKEEMKAVGILYYEKRLNVNQRKTMGISIEPNSAGKPAIVSLSADYKGSLLKKGDIITHIKGQELNHSTFQNIMDRIREMKIGDDYQLAIVRNGNKMKITEKLYAKYDKNVFEIDPNASRKARKLRALIAAKR